ncbi:MAG: DUF5680 domain-containing protein [Patescibacteria group bacterium]
MQQSTLESVQEFFFDGMLAGWCGTGSPKGDIAELPGSRKFTFISGEFQMVDCFMVNSHSNKSSGMTIIFYRDQPVWMMHYGGWYDEKAIPFLKTCLQKAYKKRQFLGGRGPMLARGRGLFYQNQPRSSGFDDFSGEEWISGPTRFFGRHWYHGMSLLKDVK